MLTTEKNNVLGKVIIFLFGLYGVYLTVRIIIFENKGSLLSVFSSLWLILSLAIIFNRLILKIIKKLFVNFYNILIIIFIFYFAIMVLIDAQHLNFYFDVFFASIIPYFLLGSFFSLKLEDFRIFRNFFTWIEFIFLKKNTLILIGFFICFLIIFQAYSAISFYFVTLNYFQTINNYIYQELGDIYLIFYCGWIGYRDFVLKNNLPFFRGNISTKFILIIFFEIIISILFLQLFGSNKAPLTVILISLSYLFYSFSNYFIHILKQVITISFFGSISSLILGRYLDFNILSNLRFFKESESTTILENTSIVTRWENFDQIFIEQIRDNLLLGDIGISDLYIHSSLFSIQTHLGLLGSIIFWIYVAFHLYIIYFKHSDVVMKSVSLPIVFVSVLSSAFWWTPLWFLLGLFYFNSNRVCRIY